MGILPGWSDSGVCVFNVPPDAAQETEHRPGSMAKPGAGFCEVRLWFSCVF